MATDELTSEEDLADLLRSNDIDEFLWFLDGDYRLPLIGFINRITFDWLDPEELEGAYSDTLEAVWRRVQAPDFEPNGPLQMVYAIARNKGMDALRRRMKRRKREVDGETADLILADLEGSFLRIDAQYADEEEKRRFHQVLPAVIAGLPLQQRAAATAFLECYEELRERNKYGPIAEIMTRLTGEDVTPGAAKGALNRAMETIREKLVRMGISFVEGSNS